MEQASRIFAALVVIVLGVACLHIPTFGTWIGLFVIVGALGGVLTPLVRKGSLWQALAMYALLFFVVYENIPHLRHINLRHW